MRRNGTGPREKGPMTGRGLGNCTRSADLERTEDEARNSLRSEGSYGLGRPWRGIGNGRGRGRAQGQGRGQNGRGGSR